MVSSQFLLSEPPAKMRVDYGRQIAYGTDSGVYFQSLYEGQNRTPVRKLELLDVQQIDVLEEYQLLIVLSGECGVYASNSLAVH